MTETMAVALISLGGTAVSGVIGWLIRSKIDATNKDREAKHADLKLALSEVKVEVKGLAEKVATQNGRVGKLEVRTDNQDKWIDELKDKPARKRRS